mmetsp:Transcript_72843/g.138386  ORF Transcript_72843/g.138386 Transcript_72843/m.138386 type:complete len:81 (+) Transcript_72843:1392-1634(+)
MLSLAPAIAAATALTFEELQKLLLLLLLLLLVSLTGDPSPRMAAEGEPTIAEAATMQRAESSLAAERCPSAYHRDASRTN